MRVLPFDIGQLDGRRVALWGWGREGRAAYRAIRSRLPALPLTLFCTADEIADAVALVDAALAIETDASAARLSAFDVVIKSPGISPYRDEAMAAAAQGTRFIGGTALWFAEHAGADGRVANTVCITGTKGKSTTAALLAHLLRAGGHVTALAGNIGLPLLEVLEPTRSPEYWVIELSSYQTGDVADSGASPEVAVVLNIFPEHLDWHGSQARYVADKLRLVTAARPRFAVLNAADPTLVGLPTTQLAGPRRSAQATIAAPSSLPPPLPESAAANDPAPVPAAVNGDVRWFGDHAGWHLRDDALYRGDRFVMDTMGLPLPGRHNRSNLCAVLTAIEALGLDAAALAPHAATFRPLPNRLQTLGIRDGITYVNDSISTTPHASLAALDCFADHRVAILLGGHDRGVEWGAFADAMAQRAPAVIVTMGGNGPRIHDLLAPLAAPLGFVLDAARDLDEAMRKARSALQAASSARPGVMLLSPGAPSFGQYRDYVARGRHFAELAGFDPDRISAIPGLGIA